MTTRTLLIALLGYISASANANPAAGFSTRNKAKRIGEFYTTSVSNPRSLALLAITIRPLFPNNLNGFYELDNAFAEEHGILKFIHIWGAKAIFLSSEDFDDTPDGPYTIKLTSLKYEVCINLFTFDSRYVGFSYKITVNRSEHRTYNACRNDRLFGQGRNTVVFRGI